MGRSRGPFVTAVAGPAGTGRCGRGPGAAIVVALVALVVAEDGLVVLAGDGLAAPVPREPQPARPVTAIAAPAP